MGLTTACPVTRTARRCLTTMRTTSSGVTAIVDAARTLMNDVTSDAARSESCATARRHGTHAPSSGIESAGAPEADVARNKMNAAPCGDCSCAPMSGLASAGASEDAARIESCAAARSNGKRASGGSTSIEDVFGVARAPDVWLWMPHALLAALRP